MALVAELVNLAPDVLKRRKVWKEKAEEARQEQEEQSRIWREQEERRRREKAFKDSKEALTQIAERWNESHRLDLFYEALRAHIANLPADEQVPMMQRFDQAQALVRTDPLEAFKQWLTPDEQLAVMAKHLPYLAS